MDNNKIMQQFHIIFSVFMVLFYLSAGIFLLFFADKFNIDRAIRGIIGFSFLLYGSYRTYLTYKQIKDLVGGKNDDEEN